MSDVYRGSLVRGAEKVLSVTYPADLTGRVFRMPFKLSLDAADDVGELTEGAGLTVTHDEYGTTVDVLIPATLTTLFTSPQVFFSLWATDPLDDSTRVDVLIGLFAVTKTPQ